jgi:hypothetical protein
MDLVRARFARGYKSSNKPYLPHTLPEAPVANDQVRDAKKEL